MLKYGIHLSRRYTKVYMMTSSLFYIQSLHVHLTSLHPRPLLTIMDYWNK